MAMHSYTPEELLGPLNEFEKKYAPAQLFTVGNVDYLSSGPRVSIVGSRKASPDGLRRAARLAALLVKQANAVIVSGLAEGIDTAAHQAAIDNRGRTIAVLGTPIDKCYPATNRALQDRIAREHLVISQFPVGMRTYPSFFPIRNRTMALISDATVIVEAGATSGTQSQAWEALRLGRQIFLAKSLAEGKPAKWVHDLLGYGAQVLSDDTLELLLEALPSRSLSDLPTDEVLVG